MLTFSERVRLALDRGKPKLTQRGLALACSIKPPSVAGWVSGKAQSMSALHLYPAAHYLGVRPEWLALGVGPMLPAVGTAEPAIAFDWPFRSVARLDYQRMPEHLRAKLDEYAALIFRDWDSQQHAAAPSAS
jgi:hypothetical protein